SQRRKESLALLAEADELERIVNLVGPEALSSSQRWVLECANTIKEGLLQQSALDEIDSYCSPDKQFAMLDLILHYFESGQELIDLGVPVEQLAQLPENGKVRRIKSTFRNDELAALQRFAEELWQQLDTLHAEYVSSEGDKAETPS
ncbi:MAG TPA: V-type ATP synthase subunit A, partial [Gammaproteobacteria bacterium]|nr:V-type ATP synthase subunit A [Gammaproteobacteria bacterium]